MHRALTIFIIAFACLLPTVASAQHPEVINRLQEYARMTPQQAVATARNVSAVLSENARRGGDQYDGMRQSVNSAVFGAQAGPGATREEYDRRLAYVISRMAAGLDPEILRALFVPAPNAALMCTNDYGLTIGQCDALLAAGSQQATRIPYTDPDDGGQLAITMEAEGVPRAAAREIVRGLHPVMLGIPRNLTRDERGIGLLGMIEACPGGLSDREAQIRTWHHGPTVPMGRCLGQAVLRDGGVSVARTRFAMSARTARAFVAWVERGLAPPVVAPTPVPAAPVRQAPVVSATSAASLRDQGNILYSRQQYAEAAARFQQAASLEPAHAMTFAALGNCFLRLDRSTDAIAAFRHSLSLSPSVADPYVGLAQASVAAGDVETAGAALRQALTIEPNHVAAIEGMRMLGLTIEPAAPPPAPAAPVREPLVVPSRDQVIAAMRPLDEALEGCAPGFNGVVTFRVHVLGETGEVARARLLRGDITDEAERGCMEAVMQSALFPEFTRRQFSVDYPFDLGESE